MKLSAIYTDGMVIQRGKVFCIYGKADPGTSICAKINETEEKAVASQEGSFELKLPSMEAGGPYTLEILASDGANVVCRDVMVGDVFLIAGQSNMELPVSRTLDLYREEVEKAQDSKIRMFQLPKEELFEEPRDMLTEGTWISVTPESVLDFSGVGYFFAKRKREEEDVAVGLVHAAIGGAHIEAFLSEQTLVKEAIKMRAEAVRRGDFRMCECDNNGSCKWCYEEQIAKHKDASYVKMVKEKEEQRSMAWFAQRDRHDMGLAGKWETMDWTQDESPEIGTVTVPGMWHHIPLGKMYGVVWLQKVIEIPEHFCNKPVELRLGTLVDSDVTYINGIEVGRTEYRYPPRRYQVASGVLCPGRNVITIRLTMDANVGGFKPDMPYCLKLGQEEISLEGDWKTRIGTVEKPLEGSTFFGWKPTALYNSMIHAVRHYRFAAILYYQGESNCELAQDYVILHRAMIEEWRALFGEQLPYIYAQLPDFEGESPEGCDAWIRMQRAQAKALELPKTAMAVLHDLGQYNELHPQNKKAVAERFYNCWKTINK